MQHVKTVRRIAAALATALGLTLGAAGVQAESHEETHSKTCPETEQGITGNLRIRYYLFVPEVAAEEELVLVLVADAQEIAKMRAHLKSCRGRTVIGIEGADTAWKVKLRWAADGVTLEGRILDTKQRVFIMTHADAYWHYNDGDWEG